MAYSPVDAFQPKAEIEHHRRERKAAQKAASHKASLSRAATSAAISSSPQNLAGPSSTPSKSAASRAWRRTSNSSSSLSIDRSSSPRSTSQQFDMVDADYADVLDGEHPELGHSSGGESAPESDHEASFESRMSSPYDILIPQPMHARDFAAVAERYASRGSPSPPKNDISLSSSNEQPIIARPFVERAHDGPGLGLRGDGHWYESEEEDGHACWTAYASNGPSNSVIVVRECRW